MGQIGENLRHPADPPLILPCLCEDYVDIVLNHLFNVT